MFVEEMFKMNVFRVTVNRCISTLYTELHWNGQIWLDIVQWCVQKNALWNGQYFCCCGNEPSPSPCHALKPSLCFFTTASGSLQKQTPENWAFIVYRNRRGSEQWILAVHQTRGHVENSLAGYVKDFLDLTHISSAPANKLPDCFSDWLVMDLRHNTPPK